MDDSVAGLWSWVGRGRLGSWQQLGYLQYDERLNRGFSHHDASPAESSRSQLTEELPDQRLAFLLQEPAENLNLVIQPRFLCEIEH